MKTLDQMLNEKGGKWGLSTVFYPPSNDKHDTITAVIETDYETVSVDNPSGDKESLAKKVALIAAAPELLEALEAVKFELSCLVLDSGPPTPESWPVERPMDRDCLQLAFTKCDTALKRAKGET